VKNYDIVFQCFRNMWKEDPGHVQWFSSSCESGWSDSRVTFFCTHLWLFGFLIFEFSVYRKR